MKKILTIISMIFCLLALPIVSFAQSIETDNDNNSVIVPIGEVFITPSNWDIENTQIESNPSASRAPAGVQVTSKVLSSYTEKNKFIGYNSSTPEWSMAKGYTLHTGKTYSFSTSLTTKWGKANVSGSYKIGGADIHFTANPQKASRLAVRSDVKINKMQYQQWSNGKVIKTWTGLSAKPIGTKTNYVKYK